MLTNEFAWRVQGEKTSFLIARPKVAGWYKFLRFLNCEFQLGTTNLLVIQFEIMITNKHESTKAVLDREIF